VELTRCKASETWTRVIEALRPPQQVPLSEWLEANLRLPHGLAAEGGPLHLWPTQRGIADALADPEIERVTLVKSARSGFTTLLTGLIGHHVVNRSRTNLGGAPHRKRLPRLHGERHRADLRGVAERKMPAKALKTGGSDGARTRDLRRDRPTL
jgi:phage terminase large subunit GpA-like protein